MLRLPPVAMAMKLTCFQPRVGLLWIVSFKVKFGINFRFFAGFSF